MRIDDEFKSLIPPLLPEEYIGLEESIKEEGCRDAIIIWDGIIIDGHNRYEICKNHNIKFRTIEKKFNDRDEAKIWILKNQFNRRNLSELDKYRLTTQKLEIESLRDKAKEHHGRGKTLSTNDKVIDTRKEIAKDLKWSTGKVAQAEIVEKKASFEQKENIAYGKESIHSVYKKLQYKQIINDFVQPELPYGKYNIILADPSWKYYEGGLHNQSQHYKTLEIEEIKKIPVSDLSADNSILFLWVTFPILKEAFEVIEAWGFKYSTVGFVWIKKNKKEDSYFFGLGNWTRSNVELCLIATRGKILRQDASISQIIDSKIEEHSKKPDVIYDKIIQLVGDLPKIELFARQKREGWESWGNEI